MATPAELLNGITINGWTVIQQIGTYPGMTGGNFSTGYIVEKEDVRGFMKAMDLHGVIPRGLKAIALATSQLHFEREIMAFCGDKRLSGIVRMLESGEFDPIQAGNPMDLVYYLIFEEAVGDIRRELTFAGTKEASWKLQILHNATKALLQLHGVDISHQDLKPSNVLSFPQQSVFKLADLGRSACKHLPAPTDNANYPGDPTYAPPEYHYQYVPQDYHDRRIASDAYLLGSLLLFLFAGAGAIMATMMRVPPACWHDQWQGSYHDVLPHLIAAHTEVTRLLEDELPEEFRDELSQAYFNLCHPDPQLRGHPDARRQTGRPVGLDRYLSAFDRLTKRALLSERFTASKAARA